MDALEAFLKIASYIDVGLVFLVQLDFALDDVNPGRTVRECIADVCLPPARNEEAEGEEGVCCSGQQSV